MGHFSDLQLPSPLTPPHAAGGPASGRANAHASSLSVLLVRSTAPPPAGTVPQPSPRDRAGLDQGETREGSCSERGDAGQARGHDGGAGSIGTAERAAQQETDSARSTAAGRGGGDHGRGGTLVGAIGVSLGLAQPFLDLQLPPPLHAPHFAGGPSLQRANASGRNPHSPAPRRSLRAASAAVNLLPHPLLPRPSQAQLHPNPLLYTHH